MDDIEESLQIPAASKSYSRVVFISAVCCITLVCIVIFWVYHALQSPKSFPIDHAIVIAPGLSVTGIAESLHASGAISSPSLFKFLTIVYGVAPNLRAGKYTFLTPLSMIELIDAVRTGTYANNVVVLTIPEGVRNTDIDAIVHAALPHIGKGEFLALASTSEGYLFPETYHVSGDTSAADVFTLLRLMFDKRVASLTPLHSQELNTTVIVASILEREGNAKDNMEIIAGIIYKRLSLHMPLQVDATLEYERGKGSNELTLNDLKTDSPYNTYTNVGLPPTPISNPGEIALLSALHPQQTSYLYYLTDTKGVFHYAKTFEEHKRNKALFLR